MDICDDEGIIRGEIDVVQSDYHGGFREQMNAGDLIDGGECATSSTISIEDTHRRRNPGSEKSLTNVVLAKSKHLVTTHTRLSERTKEVLCGRTCAGTRW